MREDGAGSSGWILLELRFIWPSLVDLMTSGASDWILCLLELRIIWPCLLDLLTSGLLLHWRPRWPCGDGDLILEDALLCLEPLQLAIAQDHQVARS